MLSVLSFMISLVWNELKAYLRPCIHVYQDIFENGDFFLRFLNDTGPHAAYLFEPSMKAMEIWDNIPRRAQRNANSVI